MSSTFLILGLPSAGKTTFLAALWHVLEDAKLGASLRLTHLPEMRDYLNGIRACWLICQEQGHTSASTEALVVLPLREGASGQRAEVVFPDMSGESFELQWSHRQWSSAYNDIAERASGAILFVNPAHVHDSATIAEEEALGAVLRADGEKAAGENEAGSGGTRQESEEKTATQVQLVDILQFLTVRPIRRSSFRLAIVVSAWDRLAGAGQSPGEWFESAVPLLAQFLKANADVYDTVIYGISAQGGELPRDVDRLVAQHEPAKRIIVVGPDVTEHDITAPLRWLLR